MGARWRSMSPDIGYPVALFGLGVVLYLLGDPRVFDAGSSPGWLRLLPLAAICLLDLLRARAPVLGLVLGLLVAAADAWLGLSWSVLLVLFDLLYSATLNGSRRVSHVIAGVVGMLIVGVAVSSLLLVGDPRLAVLIALQLGIIPLVPVWWAMNVRQQREIAVAERARADQVAHIAELDREAAVAAERSRMARDLHDVIAGHLSAIAIQSEAALSMVDGDRETMRIVLTSVRENSIASLTEMRAMIGLLRSDDAVELTAPARLADVDLLLDSARAAGLVVDAAVEPGTNLPVAVDLSAYRIVQEALTNAVKHAPDSRVSVSVSRGDDVLVVEVINDGSSPGPVGGGTGLVSMRERAKVAGGTLTAGPVERGWRVVAELPL